MSQKTGKKTSAPRNKNDKMAGVQHTGKTATAPKVKGEDPADQVARVERENKTLRATIEDQEQTIIELRKQYRQCEDELNNFKRRTHEAAVDQSKSGGKPKTSEITLLKESKQEHDDNLRDQVQQLQSKLTWEKEEAEKKILAVEREKKSKEDEIEYLTKAHKQLEQKLEDARKSQKAATDPPSREQEKWKKEKDLIEFENKKLTASLKESDERIEKVTTECEGLRKEKLKAAEDPLESAGGDKSEPTDHENELNVLKEKAEALEKDNADLKIRIEYQEQKHRELETKVSKLEEERDTLQQQKNDDSKTLSEAKERLERANKTGSDTTELQKHKEELQRKVESLEKELESKEHEIKNLKAKLVETEQNLKKTNQQLDATEQQLQNSRSNQEILTKKKLQKIQEDYKTLNQRYNDLMAHHIKQDVNNFQDINDPLRPDVMVKRVEELEANERNDFLDFVADEKKMDDNDALKLACAVVLEAYAAAEIQRDDLLTKPMEDINKSLGTEVKNHKMGDGLRMELLLHLKTRPADAIYPDIREATLQAIKKEFNEAQADYTKQQEEYLQRCVEVAWLLVLQQPPMTLDISIDTPTRYDDTKHKRFASSAKTDKILFFVWPTLMTGGSISRKGTVFTG